MGKGLVAYRKGPRPEGDGQRAAEALDQRVAVRTADEQQMIRLEIAFGYFRVFLHGNREIGVALDDAML